MNDPETPRLWQGPYVTPQRETRYRKWILLALIIIILPLFITFTALPQEIEVVRTVEIERSAHSLYALVSGPKAFIRWAPRFSTGSVVDSTAKYKFSGPPIGVGAKFEWSSYNKEVGSGTQTIISAVQNHQIVSLIEFGNTGDAKSEITIDPYVQSSVVTWRFTLDTKANPLLRWAGVLGMKTKIGGDFEKALGNLKRLALSIPDKDFSGLMIDGVIDNSHPALRAVTSPGVKLSDVKDKLEFFRQTAGIDSDGTIYTRPYPEKPGEQIVYLPVN